MYRLSEIVIGENDCSCEYFVNILVRSCDWENDCSCVQIVRNCDQENDWSCVQIVLKLLGKFCASCCLSPRMKMLVRVPMACLA